MKLSIIIPCYNGEKTILKCLNSIALQTFKDYELVIINDGSTDSSLELIETFFNEHKNIKHKIIDQENIGLHLTRKVGIDNSDDEYIGFVDADDYIENDYFEKLIIKANEYSADLVCGGFIRIANNKKEYFPKKDTFNETLVSNREAILLLLNHEAVYQYVFNKIYKKTLFKDIYYYDNSFIGEDFIITTQLLEKAEKILLINQYGYNYWINDNSQTTKPFNELYKGMYEVFNDYYEKHKNTSDKEYTDSLTRYILLHYMAIIVSLVKGNKHEDDLENKIRLFVKNNYKDYVLNSKDGLKAKVAVIVFLLNKKLFRLITKLVLSF